MGCFIIEVSHVVVVRIILTNNHIKFLTKTSIALALLKDMLPAVMLMDQNMSKLRNARISFYKKPVYKKLDAGAP